MNPFGVILLTRITFIASRFCIVPQSPLTSVIKFICIFSHDIIIVLSPYGVLIIRTFSIKFCQPEL